VADHFRSLLNTVGFFNLFPLLLGMFWGAPLVARELEQGTHRLAWTQTVTRRRWFLVRAGVLVVAASLAAWAFGAMVSSWFLAFRGHEQDGASRISDEVYNFSGLAPVGYTVYAFAIAVLAGVVFRRTLVAMGVTLVLWLPLRIGFESMRAHLVAPLKVTFAPFARYPRAGLGDWVIDMRMVGPDGATLGFARPGEGPCGLEIGPGRIGGKVGIEQCLADHGFHQVATYQPASRFWELQSIEFAVFGGLALLLLAGAYFWVTRRATA
jgi:ABC-type transport system involved in multi-copper enzyme maturation permease subunit